MADLGADGRIYQLNKITTLTSTHALVADKSGETEADQIEYGDLFNQIQDNLNLENYEPANSNIQNHIGNTSNPHSTTKTHVGLGNVTDNAQVKKISSSTDNTIMRWDGTGGDTPQGSNVVIDDNDYIYGYGGLAQVLTAGENLSAGDVCYLKAADSKYWKAQSDAEATSSTQLRLALGTINADATGLFLAFGKYTTTGLTVGNVYLSAASAGARVTTAPSASTNVVRQIGSNQSSTVFFFNPDSLYITLA